MFTALSTPKGATTLAISGMVLCFLYVLIFMLNIHIGDLVKKIWRGTIKVSGKFIKYNEDKFSREYEIGLISNKKFRYKWYKFLDELTIDLGLKLQGVSPYEFLFIVTVFSVIISLIITLLLFNNIWLTIFATGIVFCGVMCGCYTKANLAHDARIEAVIEAENILSNSMNGGIKPAVTSTFDSLPKEVKNEFRDFLNNLEDMMYISTALIDLNNKLGSIADDFIQKCIKFELEEEHGTVGVFQDVVEINNIKTQLRMRMKKSFEEVTTEFVIGALMILLFLTGVLVVYPDIRNFYLHNTLGQIIILIDALILVGEFVYITWLRAQEL